MPPYTRKPGGRFTSPAPKGDHKVYSPALLTYYLDSSSCLRDEKVFFFHAKSALSTVGLETHQQMCPAPVPDKSKSSRQQYSFIGVTWCHPTRGCLRLSPAIESSPSLPRRCPPAVILVAPALTGRRRSRCNIALLRLGCVSVEGLRRGRVLVVQVGSLLFPGRSYVFAPARGFTTFHILMA
jgi:hypothetical protein